MVDTVLITGGTGTVAQATGDELCEKGYEVIGVSRNVEKDSSHYSKTYSFDLLDKEDLEGVEEVLKGVDAVFHLAWNIPAENFDTHTAWEPNMEMFENVLKASERAGVPVFINGSSIHAGTGDIPAYTVDGDLEATPEPYRGSIDPDSDFDLRKEEPSKLLDSREENPDSPYGWSKIVTERKLRKAIEKEEFDIGVSIRIGGVNSEDKKELEGEPFYPSLYWSHKDVGRMLERILEADKEEKRGYHQFYGVSDNEGRIFSIENSFIGK